MTSDKESANDGTALRNTVPDIDRLLRLTGFEGTWTIAPATEGSSGRTFIARQPGRDLFIKLNDRTVARQRLAEIGVTPPLLAHGLHRDAPFSVYPLVGAELPEPAWFATNLARVMGLVATYQRDDQLAELLGRSSVATLRQHLDATIEGVIADARKAAHIAFREPDVVAAVGRLARTFVAGEAIRLVPSHTDPNNSNFLVTPDTIYLIDWDGITLSDPMRDIGLILWWYVSEERWPEAFSQLGIRGTDRERALSRLYWWAAVTSIRVAFWIDRHAPSDEAVRSFLDDFHHAEQHLPNPKRVRTPVNS